MKKTLIILVLVVVLCTFSFAACRAKGPNLVSLADGKQMQTMEGFGCSAAWWAQKTGNSAVEEDIAKYLWGKDGLGFNIYRYNIGGGSLDVIDLDEYWEHDRLTESFLKCDEYEGTTHDELLAFVSNKNNYDFEKDANAQSQLEAAYKLGCIDSVLLFVNSPPYIMTKNGICRSDNGADDVDNLDEENFDVFAEYLMQILKYFAVEKAYPVKYLSPINEPQWDWCDNKQEGCHYEPETCAKCLNVVYNALKKFNQDNNKNVKIDGFESGNWNTNNPNNDSRITKYLAEMKKYPYFEELDCVSFHSYSKAESVTTRQNFMEAVKDYNIKVGISEYCQMTPGVDNDDFGTALYQAMVMSYDMKYLNSIEWTWWIGVSNHTTYNYEDGLIYTNWWDNNDNKIYISPRYYAMKHFSNFVKRGDKYVEIDIQDKVEQEAYGLYYKNGDAKGNYAQDIFNVYKRADGTYIIIYTNVYDSDVTWNFADKFKNYTSYTSKDGDYMKKDSGKFKKSYTFPAKSITTLILK